MTADNTHSVKSPAKLKQQSMRFWAAGWADTRGAFCIEHMEAHAELWTRKPGEQRIRCPLSGAYWERKGNW